MKRACAIGLVFVISSSLLRATPPALPARPAQDQPVFRASSELVVLHVSVRDRGGRYIKGLTRDAFTVIDAAKPQTLTMFSAEEVPASVGVLVDNSNSMRPSRDRVIASSVAFARNSHPQDEIFVLTFNETVRRAWGPAIVAETDPAKFGAAMDTAIVARGMTAIYDGILSGLSQLQHARHTRQVLIVVSDGGDNASKAKRDDVVARVRESDATVYTVALVDPLVRDGNPGLLRRLASETGGESYHPRELDDVSDAFERIAKDIRNAYTLAYVPTPTDDKASGRRRAVKVYVRSPDGRPLRVRTRDGYFEPSPEGRP
ncbi:MAG TPA: VWA domain-containing protein [Vicinamibacterales bacterium]|nr:VWA domain-containing protein [Vicinamibacterales bacterium]